MINNKILVLISIFLIINKICCFFIDNKTTRITVGESSLVYRFNITGDYFDQLKFLNDNSNFTLDFVCEDSDKYRTCSALSIPHENMKKLYVSKQVEKCLDSFCDSLGVTLFPDPFVKPDFRPPTKGGIVNIQGSFLKFSPFDFFDSVIPKQERINFMVLSNSEEFDPTNISLYYPGGCGAQRFKWINGDRYDFSYANPTISKLIINDNDINIIGQDFCNGTHTISIFIDGIILSSTNLIKRDHSFLNFNFNQIYSKKSLLKIETSNVTFIETEIEFQPVPSSISSVPRVKGGMVTIKGNRLSSDSVKGSIIMVKIGDLECGNVKSISDQELVCTLPKTNDEAFKDLIVSVSINGITNSNKLLFNFNVPSINQDDYMLPSRVLYLNGNCFGNSNNTVIIINNVQMQVLNLIIELDETSLSFKLDDTITGTFNVSIIVGGEVTSNTILVKPDFYPSEIDKSPSSFGSTQLITLYGIDKINLNEIPILSIDGNTIEGTLKNNISTNDKGYSFQIPKGCGKKLISISIGTQSCNSYFQYLSPTISNCDIIISSNNESLVSCIGEFGNPLYQDKGYISFSNNLIKPTFNGNNLTFPLDSKFKSGNLKLEICEIKSESYKLNISPLIESHYSIFNSSGGIFYIVGKYLDSNTKVSLICNGYSYEPIIENSLLISFKVNIEGPNDLQCSYSFFNGKNTTNKIIEFIYPNPIISDNSKIEITGGQLTIYGNNFYNTPNCDIMVLDKLQCSNIKFIDSNSITCILDSYDIQNTEIDINLLYNQLHSISISYWYNNGGFKNGSFNLFKYTNLYNSDYSSGNNDGNGGSSLGVKIAIPILFGILILAIAISYFGYREYYSKKSNLNNNSISFKNSSDHSEHLKQKDFNYI